MVREEVTVSILRFYEHDTDDPLAKYTAVCTLLWESSDVVWVKGMSGTLSRKNLRQFLQFLRDKKVRLIKSTRAGGSLPFATKISGNYCEVDLHARKEEFDRLLGA